MLVLVAWRMTFMIVMLVALLLGRRRRVAVTMRIHVAGDVALMIMVRTGFLGGLLGAHGFGLQIENFMFVAASDTRVRRFPGRRTGDASITWAESGPIEEGRLSASYSSV